jgi:phage shock protein A
MKTIKRILSGFFASIDHLADQVENHEALANAALRDMEKAVLKAQVQLNSVKEDADKMSEQKMQFEQKVKAWHERAQKIANTDRQKALECLKRKKQAEQRLFEVSDCQKKHSELKAVLIKDLNRLQEQLVKLKQKRNILLTKESQVKALKSMSVDNSLVYEDIDQLFKRWELAVATPELNNSLDTAVEDTLEVEFESQEEIEALSKELDQIINA